MAQARPSPHPDVLEVHLEGIPLRSRTFDLESRDDGLPTISDDDETPLDGLLREHKTQGISNQGFWSLRLLRHILSRDRVLRKLQECPGVDAEKLVTYIRPEVEPPPGSDVYLKIFALLLLLEKACEITAFMEEKVSDQCLPLRHSLYKGNVVLSRKDHPHTPLTFLDNWKNHEKESFQKNQWEVLVPYFDLDEEDKARHYPLEDGTILPWCKRDVLSHSSSQPSINEGAFAFVNCVRIDHSSHGFDDILKAISLKDGLFALKVLYENDYNNEARFRNESDQLRRFNGLVHDHLVTLLATFTLSGHYHFLFPYANNDLDHYWERNGTPKFAIDTIQWVVKQLSGIMAAIDTIHMPEHLHHLHQEKRYGRHGDIKPDNILWFDSLNDPRGILVVSDMGLAAFHRDTSRSDIPNQDNQKVPGYRPPECDIKGGKISRAYDIWTLGCLFLEILTWLLGGKDSLDEFSKARTTMFLLTQANNNIFFHLLRAPDPGVHVAQVKPEVTEWMRKLHHHKNCSQIIHDVLDVIEKEMLLVLPKARSSSGALRAKFALFLSNCQESEDYCLQAIPEQRVFRAQTADAAKLNENAEQVMAQTPTVQEGEVYEGKITKSILEQEAENVDDTKPTDVDEKSNTSNI